MGVTAAELARYYPKLYHMAHRDSWANIQRHGLLDTKTLLDLFEANDKKRQEALGDQRREAVTIEHPVHGKAVIRDQKPLSRSKLESRLKDCSFQEWLEMLNSRVFFWLTQDRLKGLLCAREYCSNSHVVIVLDTLRLANDFAANITLAPMNTGTTQPFAHERGLSTFYRMAEYPFEERRSKGPNGTVVELAVEGGVRKIGKYTIEAFEMKCSTCSRKEESSIKTLRKLHP